MTFGEYIRAKGYTSKRLAEEIGISTRTIESYANGRYSLKQARAWVIVEMADIFDTTPKELLLLEDEKT